MICFDIKFFFLYICYSYHSNMFLGFLAKQTGIWVKNGQPSVRRPLPKYVINFFFFNFQKMKISHKIQNVYVLINICFIFCFIGSRIENWWRLALAFMFLIPLRQGTKMQLRISNLEKIIFIKKLRMQKNYKNKIFALQKMKICIIFVLYQFNLILIFCCVWGY